MDRPRKRHVRSVTPGRLAAGPDRCPPRRRLAPGAGLGRDHGAAARRTCTRSFAGALGDRGIRLPLQPSGRGVAAGHVRAAPGGGHRHGQRQDALLQPAGAGRAAARSRVAGALPLPHQGPGPGPARRAGRVLRHRRPAGSPSPPTTATRRRRRARPSAANARIVVTNPDMLHAGILPHHTLWAEFLRNLRYVVIDEMHAYRGVFGSHVANVLRRLRRVCRFYGASPGLHPHLRHHRQPGGAGPAAGRGRGGVVDHDGSAHGPRNFLALQPAGGGPGARRPAKRAAGGRPAGPGLPRPRCPDHRLRPGPALG